MENDHTSKIGRCLGDALRVTAQSLLFRVSRRSQTTLWSWETIKPDRINDSDRFVPSHGT